MPPTPNYVRVDIPERACALAVIRHMSHPLRASLLDKIRSAPKDTTFRTVICTADEAKDLVGYFQRRAEAHGAAGDKDEARVCAAAADSARTALWVAGIAV